MKAMTRPSVRSWRMMRKQPAPRATRTASSLRRPAARARRSPATLAHARVEGRMRDGHHDRDTAGDTESVEEEIGKGADCGTPTFLVSGKFCSVRRARVTISARDCSRETPALRRAKRKRERSLRAAAVGSAAVRARGVQSCGVKPKRRKVSGITPMTV